MEYVEQMKIRKSFYALPRGKNKIKQAKAKLTFKF